MENFNRECTPRNGIRRSVAVEIGKLMGHELLNSINNNNRTFSAFIVAEVTMSLRSRRRDKTDFPPIRYGEVYKHCQPTFSQQSHKDIRA